MSHKSRKARSVLRDRVRANRAAAARRPHTLASHLMTAGVAREMAGGIAGALRVKAKQLGVTGRRYLVTRTTAGKLAKRSPKRVAFRYTVGQFLRLVTAYNPRATRYVEARALVLGLAA